MKNTKTATTSTESKTLAKTSAHPITAAELTTTVLYSANLDDRDTPSAMPNLTLIPRNQYNKAHQKYLYYAKVNVANKFDLHFYNKSNAIQFNVTTAKYDKFDDTVKTFLKEKADLIKLDSSSKFTEIIFLLENSLDTALNNCLDCLEFFNEYFDPNALIIEVEHEDKTPKKKNTKNTKKNEKKAS